MTLRLFACPLLALCLGFAALPAAHAAESAMMQKGMTKHHMKKDAMMHKGMMKKGEPAPQGDAAPQ